MKNNKKSFKMSMNIKDKIKKFKTIYEEEKIGVRTIKAKDFKLYVDDLNRVRIYHCDTELTKGIGLSVNIFSDGAWYSSNDSQIKTERPSSEEMVIHLTHNHLPIIQTWYLALTKNSILTWNIDMEIVEALSIDRRKASLFLSKAYKTWIIPLKEGEFPKYFNSSWQLINSLEDKPEFIGVYSLLEEFPSVAFKDSEHQNGSLIIQNSDNNLSSRVLEFWVEEENERYKPGIYSFLNVSIQLYPDKTVLSSILRTTREEEKKRQELEQKRQEEEIRRQEQERKRQEEKERKKQELERRKQEEERKRQELIRLQKEQERLIKAREEDKKLRTMTKGPFRFYLDQKNSLHIYYKNNEITKGPGINIGIFSEGEWYASADSKAEIKRPSSEEIILCLIHNKLHLVQTWHLSFRENNILTWDVSIDIKEPMRIDRRNASIFLSKSYRDWIASPETGRFPLYFNHEWQRMNPSENNNIDFIGVQSYLEKLPDVVLKNSKDPKALLNIQNTDLKLSSRVLEIESEEEREYYKPGIYSFLNVSIQLYPDKTVLSSILRTTREEEKKRQELEQKRQEEEIRRQEQERKRQEEKERKKQELEEEIKAINSSKNLSFISLYGDNKNLHDKISSEPWNFAKTVSAIKTSKSANVKIGISKFNFFRLNEIAQFCSLLMNRRIDLRSVRLNLFPVNKLYYNFIEYIKELKSHIPLDSIDFFLKDEKLLELLKCISSQADQYNERDLLRLLGIICEYPFIGPQTIVIDTYHPCNTNCIHCWIHTPKRRTSSDILNLKMDSGLYKNIIDDAARLLCDEIIFQGDGEPLLDKRFIKMVDYARNKGLKTIFFTNGILLDKNKARKIIDMEINEIFCSLPSGTDKTYAQINSARSRDTFHKIVCNLRDLVSMRKNLNKEKPLLQMTHVIHNQNYSELEEMAKIDAHIGADKARFYLARLDDNIKFLKIKSYQIDKMKKSIRRTSLFLKKNNIELQDNIYFQLKNYNSTTGYWSENKFLTSGCPVGWFFSLILAKGEVSMCCHLRIVDYLKEKTFYDVWTSENYNRFRVSAKHLLKNKDVTFLNGMKLYDKFCNHCDTHQVILRINELMKKYNLNKFL